MTAAKRPTRKPLHMLKTGQRRMSRDHMTPEQRGGRPKLTGRVRFYPNQARGLAEVIFTFDIVQRLVRLRDGDAIKRWDRYYYLEVLRDPGVPAIMVRIEAPTFHPGGRRLTRHPSRPNTYRLNLSAKTFNLRDDAAPFDFDQLWIEAKRAVVLIFPREAVLDPADVDFKPEAVAKSAAEPLPGDPRYNW